MGSKDHQSTAVPCPAPPPSSMAEATVTPNVYFWNHSCGRKSGGGCASLPLGCRFQSGRQQSRREVTSTRSPETRLHAKLTGPGPASSSAARPFLAPHAPRSRAGHCVLRKCRRIVDTLREGKKTGLQKKAVCAPPPKMSRQALAQNFSEKDVRMLEDKLCCLPCLRKEVDLTR